MKKLTVILGLCTALLAACAVDPATEEGADIDTVEQAYGEAACATVGLTLPTSGKLLLGVSPTCATHTSPDATYDYATCTDSYIVQVSGSFNPLPPAVDIDIQGQGWPLVGPASSADCAKLHVRATVYRTGYSALSFSGNGDWVPIANTCALPRISETFPIPSSGYRIVAQAYDNIPPFLRRMHQVSVSTGVSCP